MGRSYWLSGDLESSLGWLERATTVSPNYAQGMYARAWAEALSGRALEARECVDLAMRLSPIDPLFYAMMGTRAFTHMVLNEDREAAAWADRAARSPGAHVLIAMIATAAHELNGDRVRAAARIADTRAANVADSVMYREALATAAEALGWTVYWYDRDRVFREAARALGGKDIDAFLRAMGRTIGPPWQARQKLAAAAALAGAGR